MRVETRQPDTRGGAEGVSDVGELSGCGGDSFAVVTDVDVDPDGDFTGPGGGGESVEELDVGEVVDEEAYGGFAEDAG